jgi:hypothetical protein
VVRVSGKDIPGEHTPEGQRLAEGIHLLQVRWEKMIPERAGSAVPQWFRRLHRRDAQLDGNGLECTGGVSGRPETFRRASGTVR